MTPLPALDVTRLPTPRGEPVEVRWLGTAGFALEHQGHVVLIDPYLTRASLARCVLAPLRPDLATLARLVPRADAIVVGHTHFDHVLDVPALARLTGARVFGSRSAVALCHLEGVAADRVTCVEPGPGERPTEVEVGPFRLRFAPSVHSRMLFGRVAFPGDIADCDAVVPLRAERYRCGAVFSVEIEVAGRRLLHVGSADLVEQGLGARDVDLLLLCVAGWTSTPRLVERVAGALAPRAVLLSHWDDFFVPLDRPVRALPAMRGAELASRLDDALRGAAPVGVVAPLGKVAL